ncbi:hypothetical protein RZ517_17295 [Roseovarius sp. S88]|uniref:Uncharacterized protein n=1 Tax=Roseovarius phycicola TaxID=3080976 RepID=A0ABZ2HF42_9RHOB
MVQIQSMQVTAKDMVRSRVWREGYESYRRGQPPVFGEHGHKTLAYEYGRLVAAYLCGKGHRLVHVQTTRPLYEPHAEVFAQALEEILSES